MSIDNPLDGVPSLTLHTTLHSPTVNTRTWSSQPHPDPDTPLLATASSDKTANIWDMRSWKLLSTVSGGHKRSIRCVGWKDYGSNQKKQKTETRHPTILATGSFDANVGLWEWNSPQAESEPQVPGSFETDEQDFTKESKDEEEEWHFSTLLTGPDSEIKDLKFSPSHYAANLLATCSRDKSVWVWEEVEPEEWETIAVLGEHTGDVKCLAWCQGARVSRNELRKHIPGSGTTEMEDLILGGRELLASGSYDDTIRLHHDDEAEGDWITIAVLTGHDGTGWDLKFEPIVNLSTYRNLVSEEEVVIDWSPRLVSCSDDMTVRVWKKGLSEKEADERKTKLAEARQGSTATNGQSQTPPTGFSTARLPSVIRASTSTETWLEESRLPSIHVRSVYAVDWSERTGLIVTCGGDGLIAVYQEIPDTSQDADMDGTSSTETGGFERAKMTWKVVAAMEAAHDEYEINHVCWAPRRDVKGEDGFAIDTGEYIVSSGDDGQIRVWRLPSNLGVLR